MPRCVPSLAHAASLAALALVLASCAAPVTPDNLVVPQAPNIYVTVTGCGTQSIFLKVDPWLAAVRRGQPVRWHPPATGIDSMVVQAKYAQRWPFEWADRPGQAQRRATLPGQALQAGNARGRDQERYPYSVFVYCRDAQGRDHVIDIDPEIAVIW